MMREDNHALFNVVIHTTSFEHASSPSSSFLVPVLIDVVQLESRMSQEEYTRAIK